MAQIISLEEARIRVIIDELGKCNDILIDRYFPTYLERIKTIGDNVNDLGIKSGIFTTQRKLEEILENLKFSLKNTLDFLDRQIKSYVHSTEQAEERLNLIITKMHTFADISGAMAYANGLNVEDEEEEFGYTAGVTGGATTLGATRTTNATRTNANQAGNGAGLTSAAVAGATAGVTTVGATRVAAAKQRVNAAGPNTNQTATRSTSGGGRNFVSANPTHTGFVEKSQKALARSWENMVNSFKDTRSVGSYVNNSTEATLHAAAGAKRVAGYGVEALANTKANFFEAAADLTSLIGQKFDDLNRPFGFNASKQDAINSIFNW